jgi:hypothetical protein
MIKKILVLIITILQTQSMFIGQYATPYNTLTPLLTFENMLNWQDLQNLFKLETVAQLTETLSADSLNLSLGVGVYGQPLEGQIHDKTLNVVYHNIVRDWLSATNPELDPLEFNVNALIGIFEPDGITTAIESGATIGRLNPEAISIHGDGTPENRGIYYSPNNVRFKIEDERQVASFWSLAISPDNQNAVLNFNLIILDKAIADSISEVISLGLPVSQILPNIEEQLPFLAEADRCCLMHSLEIINALGT